MVSEVLKVPSNSSGKRVCSEYDYNSSPLVIISIDIDICITKTCIYIAFTVTGPDFPELFDNVQMIVVSSCVV